MDILGWVQEKKGETILMRRSSIPMELHVIGGYILIACFTLTLCSCRCNPNKDPCCCDLEHYEIDINLDTSNFVSAGYDLSESPDFEIIVELDVPQEQAELYTFTSVDNLGEPLEYGNFKQSMFLDLEHSCAYDGTITHRLITPESWPSEVIDEFTATEVVTEITPFTDFIELDPLWISASLRVDCPN